MKVKFKKELNKIKATCNCKTHFSKQGEKNKFR